MAGAAYSSMERRKADTAAEIVAIAETAVRAALAPALRGTSVFEKWSRPGNFDPAAQAAATVTAALGGKKTGV